MAAGLYETSGDWLYTIGLPGKSGIGGGIVTVSPGKGGLGIFAPRLDAAGNSVKASWPQHFFRASSAWTSLCPRPRRGPQLAACRINLMQDPDAAPGTKEPEGIRPEVGSPVSTDGCSAAHVGVDGQNPSPGSAVSARATTSSAGLDMWMLTTTPLVDDAWRSIAARNLTCLRHCITITNDVKGYA